MGRMEGQDWVAALHLRKKMGVPHANGKRPLQQISSRPA